MVWGGDWGRNILEAFLGLILTDKYLIYPLIGTTLMKGMNYNKNDK